MKYCSTFSPSRKFAVMGVSMMEPSGLAISPRMPASWRIWAAEPRAPESAMMKMEFMESSSTSVPSLATFRVLPMCCIMALATCSLVRDQMSTTLLYRSPAVTRPETYWFWISTTSCSASSRMRFFSAGTTRSSIPMDTPALVA